MSTPVTERADILSYGGGKQTAAMCVLVAEGKLPQPARIVMANTGREGTATWDYLRAHMAPYLARHGLTVEIAGHELATVDLYGKNGDLLLPTFTRDEASQLGKMPTLCSTEWKKRVIRRYLRSQGYGPDRPVRLWLGISVDEMERAGVSDSVWCAHHYPLLLDVPTRREDCDRILARAGLPPAPKSSCWMCPHRQNDQWRDLRDRFPADWDAALAMDAAIRVQHPGTYLHKDGVPLAEADLTPKDTPDGGLPLFEGDGCGSGYCYV